jgi:hypothetical protein
MDPLRPVVAQSLPKDQAATCLGDPAGDWLCAWCLRRVATERDRFDYSGQDEFALSNPAGIRFDLITFSRTIGCRQTGAPTLDHTWFPGHAWSFCQCGCCGQQLGWYYAGQDNFVGLVRERIVRAAFLRN